MKEKIGVEQLKIGMFVADLDRPWLDTPFLIEGFLIETDEEIAKLKYYCKHVIVDRGRSAGDEFRTDEVRQSPAIRRAAAPTMNVFEEQAQKEIHAGASSSLFGTLRTIIKETFKSQPKPGGGTTSGRVLMIQTVNPPRPRAVEVQVFAHGITHDEAVKLEKEEVDLSGRPTYRPSGRFPGFVGRVKDAVNPSPKPRLLSENEHQDEDEVEFSRPAYPDRTNFEEEVEVATKTHADAEQVVDQLVSDIRADRVPDLERAEEVVGVMTESVTRNPDALMWLARLKSRDVYTYDHGLNVSIYLLAFGRHLGLPQDQIQLLGTAGLLQDIGKMKLPRELLEKQGKMTSSEYNTIKSHVGHSLDMIKESKHTTQLIHDIVAQHHERHNGSGYPNGYSGDQISMYGAMAGIADVYAAVTSTRPYGLPLAPQEALSQLFSWRGTVFNEKLVEEFIQAVGIFPVGSLVELNTGEVAAVVAQNRARRLKPRILLVLDPNKQAYTSPIMLDMLFEPPTPSGEPYRIVRGLRIGAHDVDPREQFLFGDAK
jgi:HD-GYP domain-containing protein (c-di-GMP phosphodiesterase class II)